MTEILECHCEDDRLDRAARLAGAGRDVETAVDAVVLIVIAAQQGHDLTGAWVHRDERSIAGVEFFLQTLAIGVHRLLGELLVPAVDRRYDLEPATADDLRTEPFL